MQESSKKSVLRVVCSQYQLAISVTHYPPQVTQSDSVEDQEGGDDIMGRLAARSG